MKRIKKLYHFLIFDFLLFMESGHVLPRLCRTPQVNRYVFDIIVRGYDVEKSSIKYDAAGPLQVTNVFIKDYLFSSDPDTAAEVLQLFVAINPKFIQIPLYQVQSVCGFLAERNFVDESAFNVNIHSQADSHTLVMAINESSVKDLFSDIYRRYFGAMNPKLQGRIDDYIETYVDSNTFFVGEYANDSAWND